MATKRRAQSESGIYHVFQRGVNHFDIFENDDDRQLFISYLTRYARKYNAEILAWCLMSNHVHLLVKSGHTALSNMMRALGSLYAKRFNATHGRCGALFGSRFGSVCIETEEQLVSAVRYIHRNPAHHDERSLYGTYPWSSYGEYLSTNPEICNLDLVLEVFGGIDEFVSFHEGERDYERHLDIDTIGPMGDDEARIRANAALSKAGFKISISEIGVLSKGARDRAIALVKSMVGCSLRQIQRLTAVAYSAIRVAIETADIDRQWREDYLIGKSSAFAFSYRPDATVAPPLPVTSQQT